MSYELELDRPIRFLAIAWSEGWESGFPTIVLDPVVLYCPVGTSPAWLIEDLAEQMVLDFEAGRTIGRGPHPADAEEFERRGWDIAKFRQIAEDLVGVRALRIRPRGFRAVERWLAFTAVDGKLQFIETISPAVR